MDPISRPFETDHDLLVAMAADMRHLQADVQLIKTDLHVLKHEHEELARSVATNGIRLAAVIGFLMLLFYLFAEGLKGIVSGWIGVS